MNHEGTHREGGSAHGQHQGPRHVSEATLPPPAQSRHQVALATGGIPSETNRRTASSAQIERDQQTNRNGCCFKSLSFVVACYTAIVADTTAY